MFEDCDYGSDIQTKKELSEQVELLTTIVADRERETAEARKDGARLDKLERAMKADRWTRIAMGGICLSSGLFVVPTACDPGSIEGEVDYPTLRAAIDNIKDKKEE